MASGPAATFSFNRARALTITGGTLDDGAVTGGTALGNGVDGKAFGAGVFLQGGQTIAFDAAGGETTTVAFSITDQDGSVGSSGGGGSGGVVIGDSLSDGMTGTVDISGTDSYTGTTTVESGTLQVDGSIAGSAVTVDSRATLGGSGATGAVTVDSGATFAPGDPTQFTVASLTLDSGSTFVEDIDGAAPGANGYEIRRRHCAGRRRLSRSAARDARSHLGQQFPRPPSATSTRIVNNEGAAGELSAAHSPAWRRARSSTCGGDKLRISYLPAATATTSR